VKQNVFLIGDAAGFADPITAEGITNAIESGILAGNAIAEHFDFPDLAEKAYLAELGKRILPELKFNSVLAKFFYGFPKMRNYLVQLHGEKFCEILTDLFTGKIMLTKELQQKAIKKFKLNKLIKVS
jgi:flavin-dependent dehydrogenase